MDTIESQEASQVWHQTTQHRENRSEKTNLDSGIWMQLEKEGDGSTRQCWNIRMERFKMGGGLWERLGSRSHLDLTEATFIKVKSRDVCLNMASSSQRGVTSSGCTRNNAEVCDFIRIPIYFLVQLRPNEDEAHKLLVLVTILSLLSDSSNECFDAEEERLW